MTMADEGRRRLIEAVRRVQALPYEWPAPHTAEYARERGRGSCASKHALLAEEMAAIGVESAPLFVVGALVPTSLAEEPEFASAAGLREVHECLTAQTPWAGPLIVDVTWDPPLIERGLPGTLDWDGASDMAFAVGDVSATYSVARERLREMKEALRSRLYRAEERELRDRTLAALARRFAEWRSEASG